MIKLFFLALLTIKRFIIFIIIPVGTNKNNERKTTTWLLRRHRRDRCCLKRETANSRVALKNNNNNEKQWRNICSHGNNFLLKFYTKLMYLLLVLKFSVQMDDVLVLYIEILYNSLQLFVKVIP